MRPIHVLHVASGDLWAGAEVAAYQLIRALAAREDVRPRAVVLNAGELERRLVDAGIPVAIEPEGRLGIAALAQAVRRHARGVDLVHAHRAKEDLLAAFSGRPWVSTQHGRPEPFDGLAALRSRAFRALDLLAKRFTARRVIAVSSEVEEWLGPRVGPARVVRIWNGIEDPVEAVAPPPWAQRPRRVGVLARLVPVKGLELAIDAVARVPQLELEVVGEGRERDFLLERARASGASERIHFVGFDPLPLARVARWRALLVTSHHEGNPMSVIEALAIGTPVIAGSLPGVEEMIGPGAGRILRDRDPAAWGAAMSRFIDDPGAGEAASRRARDRFVDAFGVSRSADLHAGLYRGIVGNRTAPPAAPDR